MTLPALSPPGDNVNKRDAVALVCLHIDEVQLPCAAQEFLAIIPALMLCAAPTLSQAAIGIGVSVNIEPPVLPVYVQPPLPAPGYIWTPGYWAWDGSDYYWVPGTWVQPPQSGLLWTPGYWG